MRKRFLVVCLLPLLLVTAAACSKSDDGKDVASVDGSATPSATTSLSRLDQMLKYTQCIRAHGVPMADPRVDGDSVSRGRIEPGFDKNKFDAADEACKQYEPPQEHSPDMALKEELARQFARCMREHGVENFPDPNPNGRTRVSQSVGDDPQYPQARETCDAQTDAAFASARPSP
jgi:hypothetical protein